MDIRVGKVTHFFNHLSVAVLELSDELKVGDRICIVGRFTDIEQSVGSMEIDHQKSATVGPGNRGGAQSVRAGAQGGCGV